MRISLFHTVTALVLFLSMSGTSYAAGDLTVADVQAVTKLANVRELTKGSIPGAGGTGLTRAIVRNVAGGLLAMGVTYWIGRLVGHSLG